MKVTEKDVTYVADLANLELSESERGRMLRDLNSVLGYFGQLNELDTSSVPPMLQVVEASQTEQTGSASLRPDEVIPSLSREEVLACAPDTDGVFFKVPKVIER